MFGAGHHPFAHSMLDQGTSRSGSIDAADAACLAAQREGGRGEGAHCARGCRGASPTLIAEASMSVTNQDSTTKDGA